MESTSAVVMFVVGVVVVGGLVSVLSESAVPGIDISTLQESTELLSTRQADLPAPVWVDEPPPGAFRLDANFRNE